MEMPQEPFAAPLSLNTIPEEPEQKISLDTGTPNVPISPEDAKVRAFRGSFAMTDTGFDTGYLYDEINKGNEDKVREEAAQKLNLDQDQKRYEQVTQLVNAKKGALEPSDVDWIKGTAPIPYTKDDVFERKLPDAIISTMDNYALNLGSENFYNVIKNTLDPAYDILAQAGSETMAKYMFLQKLKMNAATEAHNQTWPGWLIDAAKQLNPFFINPFSELVNRGNVKGVGFFDGMQGTNIEKQSNKLWSLPWTEFVRQATEIDKAVKHGYLLSDNPLAAASFWDKMLGQTTLDKTLDNINTLGVGVDAAGVLKMGKNLYSVARMTQLYKQAIKDVAEASKNFNATKADILSSTGDISGAGVETVASRIDGYLYELAGIGKGDNLQGFERAVIHGDINTTAQALEDLPRFFNMDMANIRNSAALSETQKNILLEQYAIRKSMVAKALSMMIRPERVPISKASREILEAMKDATKDRYPALSNHIIHISDPEWVPISNTYTMRLLLGAGPGNLFESELQAVNFARRNNLHVTLDHDQMENLNVYIRDLEQRLSHAPHMDEDTAGLNRYYDLEKELAQLKAEREVVARPGGYRIGQQGTGFHIELKANLKETDKIVRNFLSTDEYIKLPNGDKIKNPNYRADSRIPDQGGFFNWKTYLGGDWLRSAEDTFGKEARQARKAALYGQAVLYGLVKEEARYIKDVARGIVRYDPVTGDSIPWYKSFGVSPDKALSRIPFVKNGWKDFRDALRYSQKLLDKDGIAGKYFDSPEELNYYYMHVHDRLPSFPETQAYFAVKRWDEIDRVLREVSLYRNLARQGAESVRLTVLVEGDKITSPSINAIPMNTIPKGRGNMAVVDRKGKQGKITEIKDDENSMNMLVLGNSADETIVKDLSHMTTKEYNEYTKLAKDRGYKLYRIADPEKRPLNGYLNRVGSERIEYILARNIEVSPLSWQQLPRRGGGHQIYDYDNFVKQPTIRSEKIGTTMKHWYEGDATYMPVKFRAMGEDVAEKLNNFRKLLRDEKYDDAKAYAAKHFPEPYNDLKAEFFPKKGPDGVIQPARFNLHEDFRVVPRNKSIIDLPNDISTRYKAGFNYGRGQVEKGAFIDGTREGSLMRNFQVEYTGERDARGLFTYDNKGTVENPVYHVAEADRVDPLDVLNRATSRIIHSTLMDDYKIYAVESWIKEAAPYLKVLGDNKDLIFSSPFYHFREKPSFKSGTPLDVQSKLMAARYKIDKLVGTPSSVQVWTHAFAQSAYDSLYNNLGPRKALVPMWLIDKVKDPAAFIRSVVFHTQLGLFYAPQFIIQAVTWLNVAAHSPRFATAATWGSVLYNYSRLTRNEKIIDALDNLATKMYIPGIPRWKPGEWKEARDTFYRTGFKDVGGEWGPLDVQRQTKTVTGSFGTFLHMGTGPMREGDKQGRIAAWFTAFKEFREKTPVGKITNADMNKILDRADLLYNNMSTASHSYINSNPLLSLASQFYTYPLRLAEIFFSKRIGETRRERIAVRGRLILANWMMFGMPMAPGVAGTPMQDWIRQWALEHGMGGVLTHFASGDNQGGPYVVNRERHGYKDWIDHFLMEGGPASIIAMTTGEHPNIGSRMGAGGMTQIKDIVFGDPGMWKLLGGVAGQVTVNTGRNTEGLYQYLRYLFNKSTGKTEPDMEYEPKLDDLVRVVNEAQIVNKTRGWWTAINTGKYITKNGEIVRDIGPWAATIYALTGTRPQEADDSRHLEINKRNHFEMQKEGIKLLERNLTDFVLANKANNPAQAKDYLKRGLSVVVGYDLAQDQVAHAITRFVEKSQYSMIEQAAYDRYVTGASKTDPKMADKQHAAYGAIQQAVNPFMKDKK